MLKQKMENREDVLSTMISEISNVNLPRMLKLGGFDFVIIDCEHGPFEMCIRDSYWTREYRTPGCKNCSKRI